jgi:PAS domain S-box-containing protein
MGAVSIEGDARDEVLSRHDAILRAVGYAAEAFLTSDSWATGMDEVLEQLGNAAGVSRAYLFRNLKGADGPLMDEIFEWTSPGISRTITDPTNHGYPYLPEYEHYVRRLSAGEVMTLSASEGSIADRTDLQEEAILASAFVPVFDGADWWGYLGFDDCVEEREWSGAELDALRAAAATLGSAISRDRANAAKNEAEIRYRMLVEQIPAITYVDTVEPGGGWPFVMTYMSPQVREVLGYEPEVFVEDPDVWERIVHPDDRAYVRDADTSSADTTKDYVAEYRLVAADGHVVWVHDEAQMIMESSGRQVWHGVMYDITSLKDAIEREQEAASQLRSMDELKDTLLDAVSHDVRTPLAAILGLATTLAEGSVALDENEKREFAARIEKNARKLARLFDDLLDLNRLRKGGTSIERAPTDLAALVQRVVDESEISSAHPVTIATRPLAADVDGPKVERILDNLLLNVAHHTPEGTPVWIKLESVDGGVLLVVEDAGPGVPPALKDSLFEPFVQGPLGPSPGAGIGLSLVARFAELHGGWATVEDRQGGGASFRVLLPTPAPPQA